MNLRNKKILICSLVLVGIITCILFVNNNTKNKEKNVFEHGKSSIDKNSYLSKEGKQVYSETYSPLLAIDYSKKDNLNRDANYIAIVKINSIESSNWDAMNKKYVAVYSKGNATVLNVLKGKLKSSINYRRLGGEIGYNEWIKGDVDRKKLEETIGTPANPNNVIIKSQKKDDIQLEAGKTYLVFMTQYSCCNAENEYTIMAYEYGARELQEQGESHTLSLPKVDNIKVKDNKLGKWVNLSEVVNLGEVE